MSDETQEVTEILLSALPMLQKSCTILAEKECQLHGIDPTEVMCIVDMALSSSVAIRIEPDAVPIVRISAVWAYEHLIAQTSEVLAYGIRKAIRTAHGQFRWHLGRNKPATAAEYVEKIRKFRTSNPESFSLPVRSFRTRLVVEMIDPMTGEKLSREHVRPEELSVVQKEMAHELTAAVYAHEQVANLLDTLHAHKEHMTDCEVVSVDLKPLGRTHTVTTLYYNTVPVES